MNNLVAALFERVVAVYVERIAGSKITTIAGILGISATFLSQLTNFIPVSAQTYVSLGGVILAGVAAILARDSASTPATATTSVANNSTVKLGALMLISLTLLGTMPVMGCSGTQVAQDIVNWTPALQSAVNVVDSTVSVLDPSAAPIIAAVTVGFDAASNVLVAQAKAYLANPSASVLAQLQTAVTTFEKQVNTALLEAAKITNATSQKKALADINAVGTVVNTILALVASISGKSAVAQMASESTIKLATVQPYLDRKQAVQIVAQHYNEPALLASLHVERGEMELAHAGF